MVMGVFPPGIKKPARGGPFHTQDKLPCSEVLLPSYKMAKLPQPALDERHSRQLT
jgi:hypothetical protein